MQNIIGLYAIAVIFSGIAVNANAVPVVTYTENELVSKTVSGATSDFSVGTLIAGTNKDSATGVGKSTGGGSGYAFVNDMTQSQAVGTAGNNRWIQTNSTYVWDLGAASKQVIVGNAYDHDRFSSDVGVKYLEALEYTVWGSNDANAFFGSELNAGIWELATLDTIFADGYVAGETWDDFTGVLSFSQAYQYVHVIANRSISITDNAGHTHTSSDNEIEFVGAYHGSSVPEPSVFVLLLTGFTGLLFQARRRLHA